MQDHPGQLIRAQRRSQLEFSGVPRHGRQCRKLADQLCARRVPGQHQSPGVNVQPLGLSLEVDQGVVQLPQCGRIRGGGGQGIVHRDHRVPLCGNQFEVRHDVLPATGHPGAAVHPQDSRPRPGLREQVDIEQRIPITLRYCWSRMVTTPPGRCACSAAVTRADSRSNRYLISNTPGNGPSRRIITASAADAATAKVAHRHLRRAVARSPALTPLSRTPIRILPPATDLWPVSIWRAHPAPPATGACRRTPDTAARPPTWPPAPWGWQAGPAAPRPRENQVTGEQHIAITEQAHRHVTGGPGSDAGSGHQIGRERVVRPIGRDGQRSVRHCGRGAADGQRTASWPRDQSGTEFGDGGGCRKQVGERTVGRRQAIIGGQHQPGGRGLRARHRHLLTEHRPDQDLRTVDRARDPETGHGGHRSRQRGIGGQHGIDGGRIGIEIEQRAAMADRLG